MLGPPDTIRPRASGVSTSGMGSCPTARPWISPTWAADPRAIREAKRVSRISGGPGDGHRSDLGVDAANEGRRRLDGIARRSPQPVTGRCRCSAMSPTLISQAQGR